jgi:hypothetical protein
LRNQTGDVSKASKLKLLNWGDRQPKLGFAGKAASKPFLTSKSTVAEGL